MTIQAEAVNDILDEVRENADEFNIAKNGMDIQKLANNLKKWCGIPDEKRTVVTFKVSRRDGNLVVVTKKDEQYTMSRLFIIGGEWQVSIDAQGSADEVLDTLVRQRR